MQGKEHIALELDPPVPIPAAAPGLLVSRRLPRDFLERHGDVIVLALLTRGGGLGQRRADPARCVGLVVAAALGYPIGERGEEWLGLVDRGARVWWIKRARVHTQLRMGISLRWIGGSGRCRCASTDQSVGKQVLRYDWLPGCAFLLFSFYNLFQLLLEIKDYKLFNNKFREEDIFITTELSDIELSVRIKLGTVKKSCFLVISHKINKF
jgi:hypothetical protein